jgi:hypothetical protein
MPAAYKVLGQALSVAATNATLYTCPAGGATIVSTIAVCNRGAASTTFRVRVAVNGAAAANAQYLFFDTPIAGNQTVTLTAGVTIDESDTIVCQSASGAVTFQAFGQETT